MSMTPNEVDATLKAIFSGAQVAVDKTPVLIGLPPEVIQGFRQPFNVKNDMMRPSDGFRPKYIEAVEVIQRLNEVLSGAWSFEVGDPQYLHNTNQYSYVFVKGRLTIYYIINGVQLSVHREQYGQCVLEKHQQSGLFIDPGANIKAAATDALKKCATTFGIGLDMYMNGETPMQGLQQMNEHVPQAIGMVQQAANPNIPVTPTTVQMVRQLIQRTNSNEQLLCNQYGVNQVEQLSEGGAVAIMNQIGGIQARAAR